MARWEAGMGKSLEAGKLAWDTDSRQETLSQTRWKPMQHCRSFDLTCIHALAHFCPHPIHMNKVVCGAPLWTTQHFSWGLFSAHMKILTHCSGMEKPMTGELFPAGVLCDSGNQGLRGHAHPQTWKFTVTINKVTPNPVTLRV